jgi:hypothetical protein
MPRGPTSTQRIEDLEERIARLERRSIRVVAGTTSRNLNDRLAQELKPLNDRIPALQAIVQSYETLLVAIFQAYGIEADQITNAIKLACQGLTQDQQKIVRDLLRSI